MQQPCLELESLTGFLLQHHRLPVTPHTACPTRNCVSHHGATQQEHCFRFSDFSSLPPSLTLSQSALLKTWQQSQALCCCVTLRPWATISRQAVVSLHWGCKMEVLSGHCREEGRGMTVIGENPLLYHQLWFWVPQAHSISSIKDTGNPIYCAKCQEY